MLQAATTAPLLLVAGSMGSGSSKVKPVAGGGTVAPEPAACDEAAASSELAGTGVKLPPVSQASAVVSNPAASSPDNDAQAKALEQLMARVSVLEQGAASQVALQAKVDKLERVLKDVRQKLKKLQTQCAASSEGGAANHGQSGMLPQPAQPATNTPPGKPSSGSGQQLAPASRPPAGASGQSGNAAQSSPGSASPLEAMFGTDLLQQNLLQPQRTTTSTTKALRDKEVIGIYFSAHFCPPCRGFTPKLAQRYKGLKAAGKKFEIVFSSCDRDETAFNAYYDQDMPWCALPFNSHAKGRLQAQFGVTSIPRLILVDASGKLISNNAAHTLMAPSYISDFPYRRINPAPSISVDPGNQPPAAGPASASQPGRPGSGTSGTAPSGKGIKRALLIGCCYPGTPNKLYGCWNDAKTYRDILIKYYKFPAGKTAKTMYGEIPPHGLPATLSLLPIVTTVPTYLLDSPTNLLYFRAALPDNITTLLDKPNAPMKPTGANIKRELRRLVHACQPGDVAVFSFSGHGTQVRQQPSRHMLDHLRTAPLHEVSI